MRVKTLLEMLSRYAPEDNLCVLFWDKDCFDYPSDDETELTAQAWDEICDEFDEWADAGQDVGEWIADAVAEKAEEK